MPHPKQPEWTPGRFAIERDVAVDPDDRLPASVVVRHPTAPFVRYLNVGADSEEKLREIALEYLKTVRCEVPGLLDPDRDNVLKKWLDALDREDSGDRRFGWLPLAAPGTKFEHPMASYWFDRFDEKTLVLLASERLGSESKSQEFLASGFGLRVVGHLSKTKPPGSYLELRISGFSASLPFGEYRTSGVVDLNAVSLTMKQVSAWIGTAADRIERALDLDRPVFTRLRLHGGPAGSWRFEVRGTSFDYASVRSRGADRGLGALPHSFHVRGTLSKDGQITDLALLERIPQVAYATRAFLQDPASQGAPADARTRRPAREDAKLATNFRGEAPPLPASPFTVTTGKLVRPPRPNTQLPTPDASRIRSNAFGETSARVNLGRFFARLQQYGINVDAYFRVGRPEIRAVCRSGIVPGLGKDGNTVNARVTLGAWNTSFFESTTPEDRPTITMQFALADLSRRSRNIRDSNDWAAAESLGIAADPRWFWHEIGHVLLAASVGELEFRFAHSAGDALAAIASDPHSKLVGRGPARGATFPWVFVPRRHDRCTAHGWSWSGAMHRPAHLRAFPDGVPLKGYWSEQILSSSLFRLYRSVGGDAALVDDMDAHDPGRLSREAASDYVMYLIFKAIGLLGYAGAVPAHRPDHFVTALIDADIGTETFSTTVAAGTTPGSTFTRVGGCVHKVIRWAFEMQGLYAPENAFRNAPGEPPLVDVYIADRRPLQETWGYAETRYGPGSYAPISLGWTPGQATPTLWHATPDAIDVGARGVTIAVGNRGSETATGVTVKVWAHACPGPDVPEWDPAPGAWTPCTIASSAPQDIASDKEEANLGPARFGPFEIPASVPRPLVLLAMATCTDDRANTDPETNLPCARLPVPLADLVAGDNNLGLRYVPA